MKGTRTYLEVIFSLSVFVLLGFGRTARADTIYSDFGPGDSFFTGPPWGVTGSSAGGLFYPGAAFTPSGNFTLSQIDIALGNAGGTNGATVELVNDASGLPGSTVLGSWNLTGLPFFGSFSTPVSIVVSSTITLLSGTQYWIIAEPADSTSFDGWYRNNQGVSGLAINTGSGWSYNSYDNTTAFDVLGTPLAATPESGTLDLLAIGLVGLVGFLVHKKKAWRAGMTEGVLAKQGTA